MKPPPEERFTDLQQRWARLAQASEQLRNELDRRYQSRQYASAAKRRKLEVLDRQEQRARDRFCDYLRSISPRDWSQRVPCSWLRDRLTHSEAVTAAALAEAPPPAYGWTESDMRVFAREVKP